jgi:hypothetical protein
MKAYSENKSINYRTNNTRKRKVTENELVAVVHLSIGAGMGVGGFLDENKNLKRSKCTKYEYIICPRHEGAVSKKSLKLLEYKLRAHLFGCSIWLKLLRTEAVVGWCGLD